MKEFPKRGSVYWVKLDPAIGSETKKTRPGLILSNDDGNELSSRVIVAPLTGRTSKVYPFETEVKINKTPGKVMLDQIRTLDKSRLGQKMAELSPEEMKQVDKALKLVLSLD